MINTGFKDIKGKGIGLVTKEFIRKGTIIFSFTNPYTKLITEEEYKNLINMGDANAIRTGCKVLPNYFVVYNSDEPNKCEFINHSFNPTMIYYFGLCIASRDINVGEELTLDYSFIVSESNKDTFIDSESNKWVTGIPNKDYYDKTIETLFNTLGKTY